MFYSCLLFGSLLQATPYRHDLLYFRSFLITTPLHSLSHFIASLSKANPSSEKHEGFLVRYLRKMLMNFLTSLIIQLFFLSFRLILQFSATFFKDRRNC